MIDCEARISRDLNREYVDERGDLEKQKIISFPEIVEAEVEAAYRESIEFKALYDYAKFEEQRR